MHPAHPRTRRRAHTPFSGPIAMSGVLAFIASAACSTDSSTANRRDGGGQGASTANGGVTNGGARSGGAANAGAGSGGTPASSGGTAANAGAGNGGAASGGRSNSAGANSGGRSTAAGGTGNGGSANGGSANGGTTGSAGDSNDSGAPTLIDHYVTFYGWPDNDPAGNGIAYPKLHQGASGTGTYADPITFATDPTEWKPGTILYVPYLKRYVMMEDSCADCIQDWKSRKYHIDIWLESNGSFDSQVLACENTLTRSKTSVEVDPPSDRPVDATALFDTKTGTCNPP